MSKLIDNLNNVYREMSLLEDVDHGTLEIFSMSISQVETLERDAEYNKKENLRLSKELYGPKPTKGTGVAGGGT